ncbi:MAG: glycosyltransferase [Candidatus Omnitrophica bacterium]|nr:glycosyltransferase [Candidatus Omnitrophota bacterium]
MISLSHPTSNPVSRNVLMAFHETGMLDKYYTTFAFREDSILAKMFYKELFHRIYPKDIIKKTHMCPFREIVRLAARYVFNKEFLGHFSVDSVYRSFDENVAKELLKEDSQAVYSYEDGAASTFTAAKRSGMKCFYDLPIMFYRKAQKIQKEEAATFPELADSLKAASEPAWKIDRKEREIELADHIFVASTVTKNSLLEEGIPAGKITVIPYGVSSTLFDRSGRKEGDKFTVLFAGLVGPRKGVHYLVKAWRELGLKDAELVLIGKDHFPEGYLENTGAGIKYIPPVPHKELVKYYNSADLFVFPSLVEGFGMVILEAMSCGLPVIATQNTAGPDILTDGQDGFILPIRDVAALKEKVEWCYLNRERTREMGQNARRTAEKYSWERYRRNLVFKIRELLA